MKGEPGTRIVDFSEVDTEEPLLVKQKLLCMSCFLRKNADLFEDNGDICLDCRS